MDDLGEGFGLTAQVCEPIAAERICEYMHTALQQLVQALEQAPHTPAHAIDVLPQTERHQVLHEFNDTQREYPQDALIHELFEQQVERSPQATAVQFEDQTLSYAELNARANQLAHHLRSLGVAPDARVAICLERSVEMVVAILAVLKAGGAYVPLDPAYPSERLAHMLQTARRSVLLTQDTLRGHVDAGAGCTVLVLDDAPGRSARGPARPSATRAPAPSG